MHDQDPYSTLQAAAIAAASRADPTLIPVQVDVRDEAGRVFLSFPLPRQFARQASGPTAQATEREGWDFAQGIPQFDGKPVPIGGRPGGVLRVLAEAPGPVKLDVIRKAVWGDYPIGDSNVRFAIAELRKRLLEIFPNWEGEIVTSGPHGYSLLLR